MEVHQGVEWAAPLAVPPRPRQFSRCCSGRRDDPPRDYRGRSRGGSRGRLGALLYRADHRGGARGLRRGARERGGTAPAPLLGDDRTGSRRGLPSRPPRGSAGLRTGNSLRQPRGSAADKSHARGRDCPRRGSRHLSDLDDISLANDRAVHAPRLTTGPRSSVQGQAGRWAEGHPRKPEVVAVGNRSEPAPFGRAGLGLAK